MIKKYIEISLLVLLLGGCNETKTIKTYIISNQKEASPLYINEDVDSLILWAVNDFADDIEIITGIRPEILKSKTVQEGKGIYIGEFNTPLLKSMNQKQVNDLKGEWEKFHINIYNENIVISGSDIRGTVYGIFEIAERLGISPWKWWADVTPKSEEVLAINIEGGGITEKPSVQYRGIFLNDEDWGLQPWAAKTFEPETNDIGPKTYEKIFQLLLRLKANAIWPAMHPCTKAFYAINGNNEMAKKYHIVVGTSHCEPMLRNNVDEWDKEKLGDFNYFTNKDVVCNYWQSRISEVSDAENIVTLGMRGIHDGHMHGGNSIQEKKEILEKIIDDQRLMLSQTKNAPFDSIAQTIVLYKEVLDLYNQKLNIPDDVTLMWCDDNYGYIRRLSNEEEQKRSGGSGVYYHISYWGRPHDYLWLSTTQPGLIWYEMSKAYQNGARKTWIVNVGDIKPSEYNMELFLDLAWDVKSVNNLGLNKHLQNWTAREFGNSSAVGLSNVLSEYYRLASIRKPEFMGWSKVEPRTNTESSQFNTNANGNELERRILMYKNLFAKVDSLKSKVPDERLDAWFQLVEYPVKSACLMNYKFLYAQLAKEATDSVKHLEYEKISRDSYKQIEKLTSIYNNEIGSGKWQHIMSMSPRNLNVFKTPDYLTNERDTTIKTSDPRNKQRIFLQANEYKKTKGKDNYNWKTIKGLGYSNNAVTLFPFKIHSFETDEKPYIEYIFNAEQSGDFELQIRCLPTHSNNFDHKLTVQIDDGKLIDFAINTKGRSEEWKENVLRNSQIVRLKSNITSAGNHSIRIYVNQIGIVLDQISVDFTLNEPFYEIPYR